MSCGTSFQTLWISLIYVLKCPVLVIGGFLTHQVRHVTVPALKDTTEVYVVLYTLLTGALVALPLLLTSGLAMATRYTISALLLLVVLTACLTLLFIPKVLFTRVKYTIVLKVVDVVQLM